MLQVYSFQGLRKHQNLKFDLLTIFLPLKFQWYISQNSPMRLVPGFVGAGHICGTRATFKITCFRTNHHEPQQFNYLISNRSKKFLQCHVDVNYNKIKRVDFFLKFGIVYIVIYRLSKTGGLLFIIISVQLFVLVRQYFWIRKYVPWLFVKSCEHVSVHCQFRKSYRIYSNKRP